MRYSSRLFLYAPLLVLLALALAAALHWRSVAGGLEQWLIRANGHEIAPGVTLRFGAETVSGFPFNVDAVLDRVVLEANATHGPVVWRTERFAIHEMTFGRAQEIYEAAGAQSLSWTGSDGRAHRFAFVPGSIEASAIESGGRLVRFDLDINGIGSRDLYGARAQLHFRKAPGRDALDVAFSADDVHLAPGLQAGFGAQVRRLTIDGSLAPAAPLSSLFSGRDEWRRALEKWRLDKGALQLAQFELAWSGLSAHGTGRFALDRAHRPEGGLELIVRGIRTLPESGNAQAPLAGALTQAGRTTQLARDAPLDVSIEALDGSVSLRHSDRSHVVFPAGRLGPLY